MTAKELNRDIKRLLKAKQRDEKGNTSEEFKNEFMRLYLADKQFEYMNAESIKIMLRLNLLHRFESLHLFGIHIELKNQ